MATVTFDTHKYIKQLEASGVSPIQAEAFIGAQRDILSDVMDSSLATKGDITRLERCLEGIDAKIDAKFALADAKFDKLSWMLGILIALAVSNFAKQFF